MYVFARPSIIFHLWSFVRKLCLSANMKILFLSAFCVSIAKPGLKIETNFDTKCWYTCESGCLLVSCILDCGYCWLVWRSGFLHYQSSVDAASDNHQIILRIISNIIIYQIILIIISSIIIYQIILMIINSIIIM